MSNTNQAAKLGLAAYNEGKQAEVRNQAMNLIASIRGSLKSIESYQASIKLEQETMNKVRLDVVTQEDVFGKALGTGTLNANEVTILKAIEDVNSKNQEQVKLTTQLHLNNIKSYKATIEGIQKNIDACREQLSKLKADVATESDLG